jgi:very-short-patch-repair endonuclease
VAIAAGVYLVGPLTDSLTSPYAAVLACGPTAVLSHDAAAVLHGLAKQRRRIDVTATTGRPRPRGVTVHRADVSEEDRTERQGVPVTTPARTIVDLATRWPARDLDRAVEQAVVIKAATEDELREAAEGKRRGAKRLRRTLAALTSPSLTRSEAEQRLKELVRRAGLPAPITNTKVKGWEVDALWPNQRLVVEVDGYAFHASRQAFERDRKRDAAMQLEGHRVIRLTWRQVADEPHAVVATLARALA